MTELQRTDYTVESDPGLEIFVREISPANPSGIPVVMLHGGRVPSVPSFDVDYENGSWAGDVARAGHRVFLMDARGFGGSTRPADGPDPIVRSNEVVRDIRAVVQDVKAKTGQDAVACYGWATGGHWLGYYASLYPEDISHIVFFNSLYGADSPHDLLGRGSGMEDPDNPGLFNRKGFSAYRANTGDTILGWWDKTIPIENKEEWRDPGLVEAYVEAALVSDPTNNDRSPRSFRSPSAVLEDAYYLATGHKFWDASLITGRALIIFSELDFWSRKEDRDQLYDGLIYAKSREAFTIEQASHYTHLDRPERGRDAMLAKTLSFFAS